MIFQSSKYRVHVLKIALGSEDGVVGQLGHVMICHLIFLSQQKFDKKR